MIATKTAGILGMYRVSRCVMLNDVKHCFALFPILATKRGNAKADSSSLSSSE
jgi:hypothetical protein